MASNRGRGRAGSGAGTGELDWGVVGKDVGCENDLSFSAKKSHQ